MTWVQLANPAILEDEAGVSKGQGQGLGCSSAGQTLNSNPNTIYVGRMAQAYNPHTQRTGAGRAGLQGHL